MKRTVSLSGTGGPILQYGRRSLNKIEAMHSFIKTTRYVLTVPAAHSDYI